MLQNTTLFIFDLDGTLVDASDAILENFRALCRQFNHTLPEPETIHSLMGNRLEHYIETLIPGIDPELVPQYVLEYRRLYHDNWKQHVKAMPTVLATLHGLHGKKSMAVATTRERESARNHLEHIGALEYFDVVHGFEDVTQHKPHPEIVEKTVAHFDVQPEDAVMIGDTIMDIEAGNSAGVRTIGVASGAHSFEELRSARPTHIITRMSDLLDLL